MREIKDRRLDRACIVNKKANFWIKVAKLANAIRKAATQKAEAYCYEQRELLRGYVDDNYR